jgi:hypothetical protein
MQSLLARRQGPKRRHLTTIPTDSDLNPFTYGPNSHTSAMSSTETQISVPQFTGMKAAGRKITMLTAYDHTMAGLLDSIGIEGILVGDSLSMVVQGQPPSRN